MQALGFNYRLTDIQCALGTSQLRRLPAFLARRRAIAERYDGALRDVDGIDLPGRRDGVEPSWHLYVIRVTDADRRRGFFEALTAAGLRVQVHYLPVYLHPYYRDLGYRPGACPRAEDYYRRAISIPMFPAMTDADVERVVDVVQDLAKSVLG